MPEIRIHRATPSSGLRRFGEADSGFTAPYWAHWWGGGLGLARYLLDHPESVRGKRVLDLGAGSGLVGISAALAGAAHVAAADVDPYAIAVIPMNAAANGVSLATHHGDLLGGAPPEVDLVLVGDLFYETELAARVTVFLDLCLEAGLSALVGDPHRATLPLARLETIAEYPGTDFGGAGEVSRNAVFAFRRLPYP